MSENVLFLTTAVIQNKHNVTGTDDYTMCTHLYASVTAKVNSLDLRTYMLT